MRDSPIGSLTLKSSLTQLPRGRPEAIYCVEVQIRAAPEDPPEFTEILIYAIRLLVSVAREFSVENLIKSLASGWICAVRGGEETCT